MGPRRVWDALASGARAVLPIAATCAAAGIIVAVVTLTGLGFKLSSLIVDVSGGTLWLTALFSALAVLLLGLAVPVTASFIIAAVIISPALTDLGVERYAAYMFIFYYAVLSEVSPPTALSPVRGRGDHRRQPLPHDDADLEVLAAGLPRALRLRALPQRGGAAAAGFGRGGGDRVRRVGPGGRGARGGHGPVDDRPRPHSRTGAGRGGAGSSCSTWSRSPSRSAWPRWRPRWWCT